MGNLELFTVTLYPSYLVFLSSHLQKLGSLNSAYCPFLKVDPVVVLIFSSQICFGLILAHEITSLYSQSLAFDPQSWILC